MKTVLCALMCVALVSSAVLASDAEETAIRITPLQVSIWDPIQLVPDDWDVWGFRLNLPFGQNRNLYGADVGIFNRLRAVIFCFYNALL